MRNTIQNILLTISLILVSGYVHGVDYHISMTGNDLNSGLSSQSAWRTFAPLVDLDMYGGDRILLERGGIYRETLDLFEEGEIGNPFIIEAYGVGPNPIIRGSDKISSWQLSESNIYVADFFEKIEALYIDEQLGTLARFPNEGFLKVGNYSDEFGFSDSTLQQANGYWNQSRVRARTSSASFAALEIQNFQNGIFTFSDEQSSTPSPGYGYFIENVKSEMDKSLEWYQDTTLGKLYLYYIGSSDISELTIEGVVRSTGILVQWKRDNIIIRDIDFDHHSGYGIQLNNSSFSVVEGCQFENIRGVGVYSSGNGVEIRANTFFEIQDRAIENYGDTCIIHLNNIQRAGLEFGYTKSWAGGGIYTNGTDVIVSENKMDQTGYHGIYFNGTLGKIQKNFISNNGILSNYGISIRIGNAKEDILIENNIITEGGYEVSSLPEGNTPFNYGLYLGKGNQNFMVNNNSIAGQIGRGIHGESIESSVIEDNTVFGCTEHLYLDDNGSDNFVSDFQNEIRENLFFGNSSSERLYYLRTRKESPIPSSFGLFELNRLFNPYTDQVITERISSDGTVYFYNNLEKWKNRSNEDQNSVSYHHYWGDYLKTEDLGLNQVLNSDFSYTITDWSSSSSIDKNWETGVGGLNGGCMRVENTSDPYSDKSFYCSEINFEKGRKYEISLKIEASDYGNIRLYAQETEEPYENLGLDQRIGFSPGTTSHSLIFSPSKSTLFGRMRFYTRSEEGVIWVDDVEISEVRAGKIIEEESAIFISNPFPEYKSYPLPQGSWEDMDQNTLEGMIALGPWESGVFVKKSPNLSSRPHLVSAKLDMNIFPNPTSGNVISFSGPDNQDLFHAVVNIFSLDGKIIGEKLEKRIQGSRIEVVLPRNLTSGLYILQLNTAGHQYFSKLKVQQ